MISFQEKERLCRMVKDHKKISSEKARAGLCIATGLFDDKNFKDICGFYQISVDDARYWWNFFGLPEEEAVIEKKRPAKKLSVIDVLKEHDGEIMGTKDIADLCGVSLPTIYKFIKDQPGWLKKEGRGQYMIIDAYKKRMEEKNGK